MQEFLDKCFSSVVIMTIFIMVEMFFFIWLSFKNPFRSQNLNRVYRASMYVIPCLVMLAPMFTYYGVTDDFKTMTTGPNYICLFERYERGGESGDETVCRLHILNKKTGEKVIRKYIGYHGSLIGQKGDLVCYAYNDEITLYNIPKDEIVYAISKDDWQIQFKELSAGIEQVNYYQGYNEPRIPLISLSAKDGNTYWFEPFTKRILLKEPEDQLIQTCYSTGNDLKCTASNNKTIYFLNFGYVSGSKRKMIGGTLMGDTKNNAATTYLDPWYLGIDTVKQLFVFAHYTNTDKTDFIIEAKNFSLNTVWKKTKTELECADSYSNEFPFNVFTVESGILYCNVGGFVLALDVKTGNVIWKTRN